MPEDIGTRLTARQDELQSFARAVYEERISAGVAREQARKDLPLSTYTEAYWKIDLHNLLHFLSLRMEPSAQFEIRQYANVIGNEIVARWCPLTWEAFLDYRLNSLTLSTTELNVIRAALTSPEQGRLAAINAQLLDEKGTPPPRSRELNELEAKLAVLGISPPWRD